MRLQAHSPRGRGAGWGPREGRGYGFGGGLLSSWESVFLLNRWGGWPPTPPPPAWNVICFITVVLHTCGCKCPPRLKRGLPVGLSLAHARVWAPGPGRVGA